MIFSDRNRNRDLLKKLLAGFSALLIIFFLSYSGYRLGIFGKAPDVISSSPDSTGSSVSDPVLFSDSISADRDSSSGFYSNSSSMNSSGSSGSTLLSTAVTSIPSSTSSVPTVKAPTPTKKPSSPTPSPTTKPPTPTTAENNAAIIIDHNYTRLADIPASYITSAKSQLHIAYGHTSHGSQLIDGMSGLIGFKGHNYDFNSDGSGDALDLRDSPFSGASDLGNPDFIAWADATRSYLNNNNGINVVMWSWCGQVSGASPSDISGYLSRMSALENDFPAVRFVYFTGHLDGSGLDGNLHIRNEQIRTYCRNNHKILYDFEDIESYNPDGAYFGDKHPNDACDYDFGNWATAWQNSHTMGVDWYDCGSAHSQPLNANQKAYAAWALFARLAGWGGK